MDKASPDWFALTRKIRNYVRYRPLGRSEEEVEDITQGVLLRLVRAGYPRKVESPTAYWQKTADNVMKDFLTTQRRQRTVERTIINRMPSDVMERIENQKQQALFLIAHLEHAVPSDVFMAFIGRHVNGDTLTELAADWRVSTKTIRRKAAIGRKVAREVGALIHAV